MKNNKSILASIIIFVGIIIFLNLVSLSIFKRFDFSRGKIYSLTKASKESVKDLEDKLVIKAYYSKNLPGEYADARRFAEDLLSEYQAYSHGKLRFEFIDPSNEDKLKQDAQKYQIMPSQMQVRENEKIEIREVYMGLVMLYQDKSETIPLIQNSRGMEYDLTRTIKKVTSAGLKKIAFFQTEEPIAQPIPGYPQADEFTTIRQYIGESYEVKVTTLAEPVAKDVSMLLFSGVSDSLSTDQLYNLDQYLMNGGNILMFQERIAVELQQQKAEIINSNLFELLQSYGVQIKKNLVSDANCNQIGVQQNRGIIRMNVPVSYPFLPIIHNVNKENIIVKNLDQLLLFFASEVNGEITNPEVSFEPLLYTSDNSGETAWPNIDIGIQNFMNKDIRSMLLEERKTVAGIYTGTFRSPFAGNPELGDVKTETTDGKILLLADSDFIKNSAGSGVKGNLDFVLNAVDYMASESTLIQIRSRETDYKPLKEISSGAKKFIRWLNILLPSLLLIIIGIVRYRRELVRRKHIGELYE